MKKTACAFFFTTLLLLPCAPVKAAVADVTSSSQVTLNTDDSLLFYLSTDDFSCGRQHFYPAEIAMILGGMPLGGPVASIPGTSGVYMPGILFTATLQSEDGSISIPLTDPNAAHLGLPAGDMLLTPGWRGGGSYSGPIDLISGDGAVPSREAAALFASGEVVIDIQNIGNAFTFGYPGSTMANDFAASWISGNGWQSEGAHVLDVQCVRSNTPEPGTIGMLAIGLGLIAFSVISRRLGLARTTAAVTASPDTRRRHPPGGRQMQ